jgi:chromate reductase
VPEPNRLLLVSGSTRLGSTNTAALQTAMEVAPDGVVATLYGELAELPAFNPDEEQILTYPAVERVRRELAQADAVIFSTPEYAGSLPGSFKNLLDWTVGSGELYGKPVAWVNVSGEGRGRGAEAALATVLGYVGAAVIEQACVRLPVPRNAVGSDGAVADKHLRAGLAEVVATVVAHLREQDRSPTRNPVVAPRPGVPPGLAEDGLNVDIVVFEGFDELDALGPLEVLRTGAALGAEVTASLVTLDGATHVTGAHGVRVSVDGPPHEDADLVIVPGGGWNDRAPEGAWAQRERGLLPAFLTGRHATGAAVAGVCTGVMLLAAAGLVTGRPAVTHHASLEELGAAGANVLTARVVDDGDIVTAGGVTSGLDLALWILERHCGTQVAQAVAGEIEYSRSSGVWQRQR